jgi:hypothetical protein
MTPKLSSDKEMTGKLPAASVQKVCQQRVAARMCDISDPVSELYFKGEAGISLGAFYHDDKDLGEDK